MSENIEAVKPCFNECVRRGTEKDDQPKLMGALHGNFCDKEWFAMKRALEDVAEIVEHALSLIDHKARSEDKVDGSREAPMPMNVTAFNDANELYQRLVYWTMHWSKLLRRQAPGPAVRAWRSRVGFVVGLPVDVAPADARYASSVMSTWLLAHLEDICWQTPMDDVLYFHDELRDVFRVSARWPSKMKPRFAKIPCPNECQGRIAVYPPEDFKDDMRIVCNKCGRVFGEDEFEHEIQMFKQIQEETDKARKVMGRLTDKYSAA